MTLTRQLIAALVLLAWLIAGAHVVIEHGGEGFAASGTAVHGEHHHDDEPESGDDSHHHHDLGAAPAQFAKASEQQIPAPHWTPVYDWLVLELATLLLDLEPRHIHSVIGDSPPDQRASGWLFVVQTAHPVRGPALAA